MNSKIPLTVNDFSTTVAYRSQPFDTANIHHLTHRRDYFSHSKNSDKSTWIEELYGVQAVLNLCENCSQYHFRSRTERSVPVIRCWNIVLQRDMYRRSVYNVLPKCDQLWDDPIDDHSVCHDVRQEQMLRRKHFMVWRKFLNFRFEWSEKFVTSLLKNHFLGFVRSKAVDLVCCTWLNISEDLPWIGFDYLHLLYQHRPVILYTWDSTKCPEYDYANHLRPNSL